MDLQQYTKTVDGKEIHYFINDKGAKIEVVKIEPNTLNGRYFNNDYYE